MEAQYGKTRYLREVGWWKNQICRGRESRKAQGAPGRGSGGSSRRQASYSVGLLLFAEARGRRSLRSLSRIGRPDTPCDSRTYDGLKVRFSATLGKELKVEVGLV